MTPFYQTPSGSHTLQLRSCQCIVHSNTRKIKKLPEKAPVEAGAAFFWCEQEVACARAARNSSVAENRKQFPEKTLQTKHVVGSLSSLPKQNLGFSPRNRDDMDNKLSSPIS